MNTENYHGVELVSTTLTGPLRSRIFIVTENMALKEGDGLEHLVRAGSRFLVLDPSQGLNADVDDLVEKVETQLHYEFAWGAFDEAHRPHTYTDSIVVNAVRPADIDYDIPF